MLSKPFVNLGWMYLSSYLLDYMANFTTALPTLGQTKLIHLSYLFHLHFASLSSRTLSYFPGISMMLPCSVQFSHTVVSDSLWPYESQHAKPPCPSQTPGVYSNSCPSSQWCHPAISSSVVPFSSCPQTLTASGSFPVSQLFTWGGQSIGVSASASVLPMNTQDWSPLGRTGWISLQPRDSQESSATPQFKSINFSALSFLHSPTLTSVHDHWKNHSLD